MEERKELGLVDFLKSDKYDEQYASEAALLFMDNSDSDDSKRFYNWMMTISSNQEDCSLPSEDQVVEFVSENAKSYVGQLENPTVGQDDVLAMDDGPDRDPSKDHWQVFMSLKHKCSKKKLLTLLRLSRFIDESRCHLINITSSDKHAVMKYCSKLETRVSQRPFRTKDISIILTYSGEDVQMVLDNPNKFQSWLLGKIRTFADDRTIVMIWNPKGSLGKSKLVKFCCHRTDLFNVFRLPFASPAQLREIVVKAGPQDAYFIDMPRTLGSGEDVDTIVSMMEDLKNGFVLSYMNGRLGDLKMMPPHVICFANALINPFFLSLDRWVVYKVIDQDQETFVPMTRFELITAWYDQERERRNLSNPPEEKRKPGRPRKKPPQGSGD